MQSSDDKKQNLVILGGGWGGFRLLKGIDLNKYNVFVVTPRNHFLFTPLLPGSAAGTVEFRSIIEPLRRARVHPDYHFFEASCEEIDTANQTVDCSPLNKGDPHFTLKYDKLVVAVGCDVNTFNIPGVKEHSYFMKELGDARRVRSKLIENFERASNPNTPVHLKEQLLHIVASALYTDKEVFIRELISNASDALEKVRQYTITSSVEDSNKELCIRISVDEENRTFTIQDSGIGMTKDELIENIGTIAHSGSKAFVNKLKENVNQGSDAVRNIIGQFGVGFYSIFMVADKVKVYSRHAGEGSQGYCWESQGEGTYTISEAEGVARGTKIILHLKDSEREFSFKETVERIIKKYSNFVAYKIYLNGNRVNTLDAIWLKPKSEVSEEQYREFFNYLSQGSGADPQYVLQFSTDVPDRKSVV